MLQENRDELNRLILLTTGINWRIDKLVESADENMTQKEFDERYEGLHYILGRNIDDFFEVIDKIWERNYDKVTQRSCNYYLKKGGYSTRKITAYI